jgi:hypothetical protein
MNTNENNTLEDTINKAIEILQEDQDELKDEKGREFVPNGFINTLCYWAYRQIENHDRQYIPDRKARLEGYMEMRTSDDEQIIKATEWLHDAMHRKEQYERMYETFQKIHEQVSGNVFRPQTKKDVLDKTNTYGRLEATELLNKLNGTKDTEEPPVEETKATEQAA